MTYVAPGLSSGPPQNQQQFNQPAFTAGSSGDVNAGYSAPGTNRGRGGGNAGYPRGGRGRGAVGVPGQYKSIQYRPGQNSQSTPAMDTSMSTDDNFHGANGSMDSAFGSAPASGASTAQQGSVFTAFGQGHGQGQNTGFGQQNAPAFGAQPSQNRWNSATTGTTSAVQTSSSPSVFASAYQHPNGVSFPSTTAVSSAMSAFGDSGFSGSMSTNQPDSVFAVPASRSSFSSARTGPSIPAQQSRAQFQAQPAPSTSSRQDQSTTEDADSRLTRFTAVPIGNRFEEVRQSICLIFCDVCVYTTMTWFCCTSLCAL